MDPPRNDPAAVLERLHAALNRRDLAAFVDCFSDDYDSEQPAHPDRRFRGREQVRHNWGAMFAGVPDFHAELLRSVVADETFWAEWRWRGTRSGAAPLDARGVTIFGVRDGRLAWGRLYMEDLEAGQGISAAVEELSGQTQT